MPSEHGTIGAYTNDGCRCDECRSANAAYQRNYNKATPERLATRMVNGARRRAKAGNYPCTITRDDVLPFPTVCPVLGIALACASGAPTDASPSLDKIVPSLGYVPGNVAVISWRANNIKHNATARELRMVADWMDSLSD